MDWERLIVAQLKSGTGADIEKALVEIDTRYRYLLLSIANTIAGDHGEDVYSEFLCELPRKIQSFRYNGIGSFKAWLKVCLQNAALDEVRRQQRRLKYEVPYSVAFLDGETNVEEAADPVATVAFDTVENTDERNELGQEIEAVLSRLTAEEHEVVQQVIMGGLTCVEYAERKNITPEAARQRVSRAKRKFRELALEYPGIRTWVSERGMDEGGF
ncbi:MAG: sigma-70 family RNA polymerase sigma factor [Bacillota bacterium]|jgi:RNA polymerase sigma factor (sigma-70 family)